MLAPLVLGTILGSWPWRVFWSKLWRVILWDREGISLAHLQVWCEVVKPLVTLLDEVAEVWHGTDHRSLGASATMW